MNTGTIPRLEQLNFFYGFCQVRKSIPKPKLHRALTPREKGVLKQARALNDPLIIEAINLFNAEVQGRDMGVYGSRRSQTGANILGNVGLHFSSTEILSRFAGNESDAAGNAISYAHAAEIRVCDDAGNVISKARAQERFHRAAFGDSPIQIRSRAGAGWD